jgi:hypothetical protein
MLKSVNNNSGKQLVVSYVRNPRFTADEQIKHVCYRSSVRKVTLFISCCSRYTCYLDSSCEVPEMDTITKPIFHNKLLERT